MINGSLLYDLPNDVSTFNFTNKICISNYENIDIKLYEFAGSYLLYRITNSGIVFSYSLSTRQNLTATTK